MPYYAVGFGSWSDNGPGICIDGQRAKVAGPFKTPFQAWDAACDLQEGASMMCDFPYIFKSGPIKLSTLTKKIDYDEIVIQREYTGKQLVHQVRFKKDGERFDPQELFDMNNGECYSHYSQPKSRLARCRIMNKLRRQYGYRKSWDDYG